MRLKWIVPTLASALALMGADPSAAGQLSVEPILLEMNAPAASGALKLRDDDSGEVTVQTRVMRWTQTDGVETLEPATDVVSSPPAVTMTPKTDYVVRIVRVSHTPVRGEESYRVLVDQLPGNQRLANPTIKLLIRQSIPIFFRAPQISGPSVSWSLFRKGDNLFLNAANAGDERLRLASMRLQDSSGSTISFGNGLLGYVLGHSSMSWQAPRHARNFGAGGPVVVTTQTNKGALRAVIR
jgi:fimbrial chaperone protein